uniref:Uncharacterized protein n=1 Tax=Picea glauca TaxID=3330 RepID=A0A101M4X6_PICGL|nr:hypothetical protein ABT39_MTgene1015 [Picea glauca]
MPGFTFLPIDSYRLLLRGHPTLHHGLLSHSYCRVRVPNNTGGNTPRTYPRSHNFMNDITPLLPRITYSLLDCLFC